MLLRLVNKQAYPSTDLGLSFVYLLLLLPLLGRPLLQVLVLFISALLVFVMFLALIWTCNACVCVCVCVCARA